MDKLQAWKWAAVWLVCLSLGAGAWAADTDKESQAADKPEGSRWFSRWFGKDDKKAKDKNQEKPLSKDVQEAPTPIVNQAALARSREEANYLRRLAVCNQLMQIAYDTKDETLQRKAEQLDDRVWKTYQQRIARLPVADIAVPNAKPLDKQAGATKPLRSRLGEPLFGSSTKDHGDAAREED